MILLSAYKKRSPISFQLILPSSGSQRLGLQIAANFFSPDNVSTGRYEVPTSTAAPTNPDKKSSILKFTTGLQIAPKYISFQQVPIILKDCDSCIKSSICFNRERENWTLCSEMFNVDEEGNITREYSNLSHACVRPQKGSQSTTKICWGPVRWSLMPSKCL